MISVVIAEMDGIAIIPAVARLQDAGWSLD